jgi:hypothetical protein
MKLPPSVDIFVVSVFVSVIVADSVFVLEPSILKDEAAASAAFILSASSLIFVSHSLIIALY